MTTLSAVWRRATQALRYHVEPATCRVPAAQACTWAGKTMILLSVTNLGLCQATEIGGVWQGLVKQGQTSFHMRMHVFGSGETGRIDYPELQCGGSLALIRRKSDKSTNPDALWFRERIEYGSCIDGGEIRLSPLANGWQAWEWEWRGGAHVTVYGIISGFRSSDL